MKKLILTSFLLASIVCNSIAQEPAQYQNTASKFILSDSKLTIGGYGQIDYNQPLTDVRSNGILDVHRMVLLFGYKFNDRTSFVSEIELEHVVEVFVEQAFLNYQINNFINFRAGLMLIPMGIINEYHEPTTYNGVERPLIDSYIAPSTWREIGLGFTGSIYDLSLRYQAYLVNGFNGYDGAPHLRGKDGLRKGRQKGSKSYISSPNFAGKIEYFGISGLNLGASAYVGNSQSTAYNGLDKDNSMAVSQADSTAIGIAMLGLDARYKKGGLSLKGQYYFTTLSNTDAYNRKTGSDLGSAMFGYYLEAAYDVFHLANDLNSSLTPFVRFEAYNTHAKTEAALPVNKDFHTTAITTGLGWKMARGAVLKADVQFIKTAESNTYAKTFNAGVGVWF